MKNRSTIIAVAAVVVVALAVWVWRRGSGGAGPVDLVAQFTAAEKRPAGRNFPVDNQTLEGQSLRAIEADPPSRIVWKVAIPRDAWLRTSLGLKPDAWTKEGNGVLFRVGVSDGKTYEELLNQHVNPFGTPADRRWIPVNLDLSAYSDMKVEVIFNTNTSPPNRPDDPRNDFALWGEPQIYVR